MLPKNFPGRKNSRRAAALGQLISASKTKADRLDRAPGFDRAYEIRSLKSIIVADDIARSIRTKKDRSARARLRA